MSSTPSTVSARVRALAQLSAARNRTEESRNTNFLDIGKGNRTASRVPSAVMARVPSTNVINADNEFTRLQGEA